MVDLTTVSVPVLVYTPTYHDCTHISTTIMIFCPISFTMAPSDMMYFIFYKFYPTTLSTIILLSSIFTPTYVTISITIYVITFTIDVILILYVMVRPSLMTVIIYVTNLHLSSLIHLPYVMTYVITIAVIVPIYFAMAVNWHHLYAIVNDVMICGHQ